MELVDQLSFGILLGLYFVISLINKIKKSSNFGHFYKMFSKFDIIEENRKIKSKFKLENF